MQERGVLRHHGDGGSQAVLADAGDVLPVDQDSSALEVVQAQEQRRDGGLAGAAGAHEPDLLAGPDGEVEIIDDAVVAPVMERHVFESHLSLASPQRWAAGHVDDAVRPGDRLACSPAPRRYSRRARAPICITQPDMARMRMTSAMPVAALAARHLAPHPEQDGQSAGRDEQGSCS